MGHRVTPKTQLIKGKIDQVDLVKIKNFSFMKDYMKRMKRQATDWEIISNKETIPRLYKELLQSTVEKRTIQFKNGQMTGTDISLKRIYRWQIRK